MAHGFGYNAPHLRRDCSSRSTSAYLKKVALPNMISLHKSSGMGAWQWAVSLLLLAATMINYMDRQTLANLSVRITQEFDLTEEQYGNLEFVFGVSFACGSLLFGILADIVPVRILYPLVLMAWSAIGFATGLTTGYESLFYCRALLGFFESGHWPCALVVTHAILTSRDRALGNSILQSGASLGAIITPLIITAMVAGNPQPDAWRPPFLIVGSVGIVWVVAWLIVVRKGSIVSRSLSNSDVAVTSPQHIEDSRPRQRAATSSSTRVNPYSTPEGTTAAVPSDRPSRNHGPTSQLRHPLIDPFYFIASLSIQRKFWALVCMVVSINCTWQMIRAWLPKFLQQGRGYEETTTLLFNSAYYIATDVGCLCAGAAALWLARRGMTVHGSRLLVYGLCASLSALTVVASQLPASGALLGLLLVVGAGTLGLFPCYYSFTQEVDARRVGKLTGVLSFLGWLLPSPIHRYFGRYIDATKSFDWGIALIGLVPLLGLIAMLILWPRQADTVDADTC